MALTGLRGAPSGGLRVLPNKPLLQILVAGAAVPETHEGTEAAACLSRYRLPRPASPPHFLGAEKSLPTCAASCSATQLDPAHSGSSSGREPCAECRGRNTTRRLSDVYCAPRSLPPQGLCSYCPSGTFSYTLPPYNTAKHPHALNGLHPRRRGRSHEESLHEDLPPGVL